jgi:DNA-binding transcriptional regulator YiaG
MAYIPNLLNKPFINHIDGNKLNNNVQNLEWITMSENTIHAFEQGLRKKKLTNDQVREIRGLFQKYNDPSIARRYNVSRETIRDIRNGRLRFYVE